MLRTSNDQSIRYLVKFYDKLSNIKDGSNDETLLKQMESVTMDIMKNKTKQARFKQLAPKLLGKLVELYRNKDKDKGRDL